MNELRFELFRTKILECCVRQGRRSLVLLSMTMSAGSGAVFRTRRTFYTVLPICFIIFTCLLSIALILPSFLFSDSNSVPLVLHGPITFRWQMADAKNDLRILLLDIEDTELYHQELLRKNRIPLHLPVAPIFMPGIKYKNEMAKKISDSTLFETVFNFSKCSVVGNFGIYVYKPGINASDYAVGYYRTFSQFHKLINDPNDACLFFAFVDDASNIESLEYWNNGQNHVLVNVGINPIGNYLNAVIVSSSYGYRLFKDNFDISLYVRVPDYNKNGWKQLSPLLPLARKYLLSCVGVLPKKFLSFAEEQLGLLASSAESVGDRVFLDFSCKKNCTLKSDIYHESMFSLLLFEAGQVSTNVFHEHLLSSLRFGAVPIITALQPPLPFMELFDWRRAVFVLPIQRLPELHFILRSFAPADVLEMRRQGRFLLENYLTDKKVIAETLIAALRHRIGVPGEQTVAVKGSPLFSNQKFSPPHVVAVKPPEEEYLGPREAPHNSIPYTHNYTSIHMYSYHWWNDFGRVAGRSLEYIVNEPPFPSQFEYGEGLEWGFRPIAPPASGATFSSALGGNRPREQFTVVFLTYQRDAILATALERLNNIPYLNKVLVIWNGREAPLERNWPRLHVPVIFINSSVNSLNNRFLPYEEINTEAVLSLDDDIELRQHEIIFAFRVWREQRNKIVGFPARRHSQKGNEILYDSNHTCQLSMILTGAAFIHKAYFYAYTYGMPQVIKEKVDELMNCEDLAMNFLVAHLIREPPIKTTSKWTLRCPACKASLYQRSTHYHQRHECIQFFTQVYGYNPLLFTQVRVDSVLFKTRLPTNHQKCFKYV
ncbi:unnamed protein product [Thelazia callipaeda]|uniref:Exostosin domain-containing protein n=1 Tax=Thelazia callipaeda TaxID=103827 RepID=A0A158RCP7_THECL|nr:unnamed protein product [Thelazia callipaeda]